MELYYGVVEDIQDPKKLGRVKVRVVNVHTKDRNVIPTADLPWALVMAGTTTPSISGVGHSTFLLQGSWVVGTFTDTNLQAFLIMGSLPTISGDYVPSEFGFTDPSGQYPRNQNEEDNNLRTRGNPDPNDYEVQGEYQPRSAYAPIYPYNHVYESESGHIKEYDDTPGSQRIRERHNSGTYYEVQPGGSKIERVVADNYELILGDDTIEVKGNVNIIVSEDVNLSVAGNVTANIGNNLDFLVHGDVNGEVRGNIAMRVGANLDDHVTEEDGISIHHPAENTGNIDLHIEGDLTGLIDGHVDLTVLQDVTAKVLGKTTLDCPTTQITGDVRIDGELSVGKDVNTDHGVSVNTHTHTSGVSGHAGTTSTAPNV